MASSLPMTGGTFYTNSLTEVLVDPAVPNPTPQSQSKLQVELKRCEALAQRDFRYAHLVAGASKMPMASIWVARNQDEVVNDVDLATFKDLAWTEFVKKRFLAKVSPDTSVASAATSMLEIVRDMNLQRRRFLIMGLHEQVEASELQLVMHLCQANILKGYGHDFKRAALRMRRSDRLFEAFSQAVGAFVCATAPMTLGAGTSRYERDLQYEYKKQMVGLLVYALQQNPRAITEEEGADEDYVARISRLIVVWQGRPGDSEQMVVGESKDDGNDKDADKESVKEHLVGLSNAIALAQHDAQEARDGAKKVETRVKEFEKQRQMELNAGREALMTRCEGIAASVDAKIQNQETRLQAQVGGILADNEVHKVWHKAEMDKIQAEWREHASQLQVNVYSMVRDFFTVGTDGKQTEAQKVVQKAMVDYTQYLQSAVPVEVHKIVDGLQLGLLVDTRVDECLDRLRARIDAETHRALGDQGLLHTIGNFVKNHLESDATIAAINGYLESVIGARFAAIEQAVGGIGASTAAKHAETTQLIHDKQAETIQLIHDKNAEITRLIDNKHATAQQNITADMDAMRQAYDAEMAGLNAKLSAHVDEMGVYRTGSDALFSNIQADVAKLNGKITGAVKMEQQSSSGLNTRQTGLEDQYKTLLQNMHDMNARLDDLSSKKRGKDGISTEDVVKEKVDALRKELTDEIAAIDTRTFQLTNDLAAVDAKVAAQDTKPAVLNDALRAEVINLVRFAMDAVIQQSAGTTAPPPADFFSQFHAGSLPADMMYSDATSPAARGPPRP